MLMLDDELMLTIFLSAHERIVGLLLLA